MARRHHYRRRLKGSSELDVTTFLNLMVVLVPFLLITAVFSRITVVELNLPSARSSAQTKEPAFRVEVIVRESGLEITNGKAVIAGIPNVEGDYDLERLSHHMIALKGEYPDTDQASVLLEPTIHYDYLIQVMDVVRSAEIPPDTSEFGAQEEESDDPEYVAPVQLALFTEISIGEAP